MTRLPSAEPASAGPAFAIPPPRAEESGADGYFATSVRLSLCALRYDLLQAVIHRRVDLLRCQGVRGTADDAATLLMIRW